MKQHQGFSYHNPATAKASVYRLVSRGLRTMREQQLASGISQLEALAYSNRESMAEWERRQREPNFAGGYRRVTNGNSEIALANGNTISYCVMVDDAM